VRIRPRIHGAAAQIPGSAKSSHRAGVVAIPVQVRPRLSVGKELAGTDPEFRERPEVFLVSAGDRVVLSAFHLQTIFPVECGLISSTNEMFTSTERWIRMNP